MSIQTDSKMSAQTEYEYTCPNCLQHCTVPESLVGRNLTCPGCKKQFFSTPPESPPESPPTPAAQGPQAGFAPPSRLPFFKSARKQILEQRLQELLLINRGVMADDARQELRRNATVLGLSENAADELLREHFFEELARIKERMQDLSSMTDHDYSDIEQLKKKYNYDWSDLGELRRKYGGNLELAMQELSSVTMLETDALTFELAHRTESTGYLQPPIKTELLLNKNELVYNATDSVWAQTRVHTLGYAGPSISLPTGIKHVRFRFGGYAPIRSEELTELSRGALYVSSERLLFKGDSRNTTIPLKKIIDVQIFADALRVEKSAGKPDYFSMKPVEARYILALVGRLK